MCVEQSKNARNMSVMSKHVYAERLHEYASNTRKRLLEICKYYYIYCMLKTPSVKGFGVQHAAGIRKYTGIFGRL